MTKTTTLAVLGAACALLAACGGGSDAAPPPPPPAPPPAPQSFDFVLPAVGETDVWTRTLTDTAGSSVSMQIRQRVTAVSDSGVQQYTLDDPTGTDIVEDGVTFRTTPEVADVAANGNTMDYTNTAVDGTQITCAYGTPVNAAAAQAQRAQAQALRHAQSLVVGTNWTVTYTLTCGSQPPVSVTANAAVLSVESVSVAAGTFQAVKEISDTSYTVNGITYGTGQTTWRDPARSLFPVKSDIRYSRSDSSSAYIAHETRELLSRQ